MYKRQIPALGAFQLQLTPFNSTPTFAYRTALKETAAATKQRDDLEKERRRLVGVVTSNERAIERLTAEADKVPGLRELLRAREGDLSETRDALQVSRDATAAAAAATERLSNELRASRLDTENAREECVTLQRERDDVLRPTVDALRARIAAETKRKISVGALTRRCAALRRAALTSCLLYTSPSPRD